MKKRNVRAEEKAKGNSGGSSILEFLEHALDSDDDHFSRGHARHQLQFEIVKKSLAVELGFLLRTVYIDHS